MRKRIAELEAENEDYARQVRTLNNLLQQAGGDDEGFPPLWNDGTLLMRWFIKRFGSVEIGIHKLCGDATHMTVDSFREGLENIGYWYALAKRLYAIFDRNRDNNLPISDFSDPRSDWYLNATTQDHVEREERMWSDALHFRDMGRLQADLLREQQERDAERRLWEDKEVEYVRQIRSAVEGLAKTDGFRHGQVSR